MKNRISIIINRLLCVSAGAVLLVSCAAAGKDKDEKYYERQQKLDAKAAQAEYDQKVKEHRKMQSEQTIKMMRQSEKEAKKLNKHRER